MSWQETDIGKNKPASIVISGSKHDIKLLVITSRRHCAFDSEDRRKNIFSKWTNCITNLAFLCYGNTVNTSSDVRTLRSAVIIDNEQETINRKEWLPKSGINTRKPYKQHLKSKSGRSMSTHLRRKSSPFVHLIMTSFTLWTLIGGMSCEEFNVTWNMKTNPAIMGNDVILECVISGEHQSCDKYPRQWYGGVNYGLLCEDGMCRNNTKYKEVTISSCKHHLVIYNFTEQDLNQTYTCSYGIVNDRKGLALKDGPFELHPSKKSFHDIIKVSDKSISVHLQMLKVYPMPRCNFTYKETNITKYVQESVEMNGSFFKVNYTLNYPINDHCKDEIMISCTIGTYKMNTSDNCQEENRQSGFSIGITGGIVVGVACIIAFAGVALVLYRRSRSGHTPVTKEQESRVLV